MDSELIPLESGETCVAAIMTAQSENSKLIVTAQKTDKEISIVREWLLAGKFPNCVQEFAPASILDWQKELILRLREHSVAQSFINRRAHS